MSMNQGKLEVVIQDMARVNIDILGISELRFIELSSWACTAQGQVWVITKNWFVIPLKDYLSK